MSQKIKRITVVVFVALSAAMLIAVLALNLHTSRQSEAVLEESIKSQLVSISNAARELINPSLFAGYNSKEDTTGPEYAATLASLRVLAANVGADYIYALKEIGGQYYFVFDTDVEDPEVFGDPYELSGVHLDAFRGRESAGVLNVSDAYGDFNTGAVPIFDAQHRVIGIIGADLEDRLLTISHRNNRVNLVILIVMLVITVFGMGVMLLVTFTKLNKLEDHLEHMAKYDKLTNLPNRTFLLEHLTALTTARNKVPFALMFIDLDNFKAVNDNAGHDAGDSLLINIASFLEKSQADSQVFRPVAGKLNVAARIGGDEFVMVANGIDSEEKAAAFADELFASFKNDLFNRHIEMYEVGFSIGIALYPYHSEDFNVLIKYADIAMYGAKNSGKNRYTIYNETMYHGEEGIEEAKQ